jgi:peptide/nickel transport system substrate-binding protein
LGLAVALAGCAGAGPVETPVLAKTPASATPPGVETGVVAFSSAPRTLDPVAVSSESETAVAQAVFQRLMRIGPDGGLLPDAASDCLFSQPTTYQCTLPAGAVFSNGHPLTSSDVEFSIRRALRLSRVAAELMPSLDAIETPDDTTVRFQLAYADAQFGYSLCAVQLSIVDERTFDADGVVTSLLAADGSGPYQVERSDEEGILLRRWDGYTGQLSGRLPQLSVVARQSATAEAGMALGDYDVVWQVLEPAALERLRLRESATPATGGVAYQEVEWARPRLNALYWSPSSSHRGNSALRQAVAAVLQADRSADSLLPVSVEGHAASFAVGGTGSPPALKKGRVKLRLGYDPSAPGAGDLARLLRDRIEQLARVSVQVVAGDDADLVLSDALPPVGTPLGWLERYLADPLEESRTALREHVAAAREGTGQERAAALAWLQTQAGVDLTALPVSPAQASVVVKQGVTLESWTADGGLALWGVGHG